MIRALLVVLSSFASFHALAARPELKLVTTKHYLIHSDLDDALIVELGTRLDAMYAEYSRRLADFDLREDGKSLDVYLFERKRDYAEFTGNRYHNTGGVFLPASNQLAAYLEGQRDTLRRTLQHEAFHQFAHKALRGQLPIWLNEGLAQLFEEAIWTGETFLMGQVPPRRLRQLQADAKGDRLLPLAQLMALSPEQWSRNLTGDAALGATQYNQAWATVHFMAYGDRGQNGVKLVLLLKALQRGRTPDDAFRESFGAVEPFWAAFKRSAAQLEPTPEAEWIDRHEVLADLCVKLAQKGKRFASVAEFRRNAEAMRYRLRYRRGEMSWVAEPAAYFRADRGVAYGPEQMSFERRRGAPLPDLVLRLPRLALRARFYAEGKGIEQEVVIDTDRAATSAGLDH